MGRLYIVIQKQQTNMNIPHKIQTMQEKNSLKNNIVICYIRNENFYSFLILQL